MMSTDPYFPFRPDVWWPDLFEPLSRAEREELINGLAINCLPKIGRASCRERV